MRCDLHLHSAMSDGVLTPEELLHAAEQSRLECMAVTDHDTFAGYDRIRSLETTVTVIPGIELSMAGMKGLHLLGYGLTSALELRTTVKMLAQHRKERSEQILDKLERMGLPLEYADVKHMADGTAGRPHIARAMVAAGYVRTVNEAFQRYLNEDAPAYVPGEKLTMTEALPLLRRNGFIPVLAHPAELQQPLEQLESLICTWQKQGLMGMEVYHPSGASLGYDRLDHMARRHDLLVTGGSDFHAPWDGKHGEIGCMTQRWITAREDVQAFMHALKTEN